MVYVHFFIKDKPGSNNCPQSLPRNPPDWTILDSWAFDNFILADKLFAQALQSLENCLSVSNNLRGKLVSTLESPITFDERFKVTLAPFFTTNFDILCYELDNFMLSHLHIDIILYDIKLNIIDIIYILIWLLHWAN